MTNQAPRFRNYKGAVIENVGLSYYAWVDFVTAPSHVRQHTTLAAAKATVTASRSAP